MIKKNVIFSLLFIFLAGIMLVIGFIVPSLSNTEVVVNPTEFEATVTKMEKRNGDYLITIEEYNCKLFVDVDSMVDKERTLQLNSGEKIFFRLVDLKDNPLENPQIQQIFVVTLRTETKSIITMESYALKENNSTKTIKNVCVVAAILFSGISLFNIVAIAKKTRNKEA